jgi:hypothetical protein
LPHCANSSDFEEETLITEITNIGREVGFDGLENDVRELLNSHLKELIDDDFLLLDQQEHLKKPTLMPKNDIMCK